MACPRIRIRVDRRIGRSPIDYARLGCVSSSRRTAITRPNGAFRSGVAGCGFQVALQFVRTADPLTVDEHLRSCVDSVLVLEGVDLHARVEIAVVKWDVRFFEQLLRSDAKRTDMVGQD